MDAKDAEKQIEEALASHKALLAGDSNHFSYSNTTLDNKYCGITKKVNIDIYSTRGDDVLPEYATAGSSGMDLRAFIDEPVTLQPFERKLIPTGIFVNIPSDYEFEIRPRSGLSIKRGLTLINCVGTIDDDYIKEIFVPLVNLSNEAQTILPDERIAQMVLRYVEKVEWNKVESTDNFDSKDRTGGFGSTGII